MSRPRLAAFCVILMFVGSGVVWSQSVNDAYDEFVTRYTEEFYLNQDQESYQQSQMKMAELAKFTNQVKAENREKLSVILSERINALGESPPPEQLSKVIQEIYTDNYFAEQLLFHEKHKEIAPEKSDQRHFQMMEGIFRRMDSMESYQDMRKLTSEPHASFVWWLPDFLELSPEQKNTIVAMMKKLHMDLNDCVNQAYAKNPEKVQEQFNLNAKLPQGVARTKEELDEMMEIYRKKKILEEEMMRDAITQLKAILIEGRTRYMRVLTDAQKAKIEAVMADMPDYMKNLFAAIDREGGGLSILHNWQPGMGVPDVPNPNREAPRERSNTGGRTFPGSD